MIFYTSQTPLSKQQVSESPWLTQWHQIDPKSHTELAELLSHPLCVGCSLGNTSNKLLTPLKVHVSSDKTKNVFSRSSKVINSITNVFMFDIEVSSTLEQWVTPPLDSIDKVEEFILSCGLKSYIIGRSSSSIEKDTYFKWHVYCLFDNNISMVHASNFVQHRVPKDSWFYGLTSSGQIQLKNSYLDTSVFSISRLIYEHRNVTFKVVDNGLNHFGLIKAFTKPYKPNPFTIKQAFPDHIRTERESVQRSMGRKQKTVMGGFLHYDDMLIDKNGRSMTVKDVIDGGKDIRLASFIDMSGTGMQYRHDTQTFFDWHDGGKRYVVTHSLSKTIEYSSKYLPPLDLTHDNTFILAPTGSGKTTAIKNANLGSTIFIAPRKAIVKDLDGMVSGLHRWDDVKTNEINIMTFNKLAGHISHKRDISEFNIVIDEIHVLFTDPHNSIYMRLFNSLIKREVVFKKLILLSATMEAEVLPIENLYSFKYINVSKKTKIQFLQNVTEIDTLIKGTTLIFQQSRLLNASLYDRYSKTHRVLNLKAGSDIPKDLSMYDIIITTSVLREGFSITSNIDTVLVYNVRNAYGAYDLIQSIARPRVGHPEILIISATTHFTESNVSIPTLASLYSAAEELAQGYLPSELLVLQAINIEQFKRFCLMLDTEQEKVVVNRMGTIAYYLTLKASLELKDFSLMTNHLKEYLLCDTSLIKMTEDKSELPQLSIKGLKTRLQQCSTFKELEDTIQILESAKDYAAQCQELLDSIEDTVQFIETTKGVLHLNEEQQVQYKVNKAMFAKINQHKRNMSEGVYDTLNKNRSWRTGNKFTIGGLKKIFKILDPKKTSFKDEEVISILKKVCKYHKETKEGLLVLRGDFDYIVVDNKSLIELSTLDPNKRSINVAGI